jgi:DNA-binding MarR family transcriptional regulator
MACLQVSPLAFAADCGGQFSRIVSVDDRSRKRPISTRDVDLDILENTLSFYIRSINLAVSRDLDERLDGLEVARGTGKITTLLMVDRHPGIRPSIIAKMSLHDRSAMARLVDQMEEQGLLKRSVSAEDGRAQELFITRKGAALADRVRGLVNKQSREFFHFVSKDEQKLVIGILRRIYRRIAGLDDNAAAEARDGA